MSTTELAALVGILMPVIVTIVKRAKLAPLWNALIAIAACGIAGTLTAWLNGDFVATSVATAILAVYAVAQGLYQTFWNLAPMAGAESKLNKATG